MHISHRQLFFENLAQTSDSPLAIEIARAEGLYLYTTDGRRYMDLISGIAVSNVGHRHPKVLEAIKFQLDRHLHSMVYGEYIQSPQVKLAQALVKTLDFDAKEPAPLGKIDNVYFTNSGTEAIEGAMKLAKRVSGRTDFISCVNAYHGATQGALSLAGAEFFKTSFRPLMPGMRHIRHGTEEDLSLITHKTAAVVIEIVGGESGIRMAPKEYFQALRKRCSDTGALLILDEVQTGFGRTGTFWAFEAKGIYPDILVAAKGMGGGLPLGAFMASRGLMQALATRPVLGHITTFGGHPLSCAAALATLEIIQEDQLAKAAIDKGNRLKSNLRHNKVGELRGEGLMIAADFGTFDRLKRVIDAGLRRGVITDWFLFCDHSMRLAPPLSITNEEIDEASQIILEAVNEVL